MSESSTTVQGVPAFQPELVAAGHELMLHTDPERQLPEIIVMRSIKGFLELVTPLDLEPKYAEKVAQDRERLAAAGRAMLSRQIAGSSERFRGDGFNAWRQSVIDGPDEGVLDQVRAWVTVSIIDWEREQSRAA